MKVKTRSIKLSLIASLSLLVGLTPSQANCQVVPQPWISGGVKDSDLTFSVGVRALGIGVELGVDPNGTTGVDILKFINLPVISFYVGLGLYSEDEGGQYQVVFN